MSIFASALILSNILAFFSFLDIPILLDVPCIPCLLVPILNPQQHFGICRRLLLLPRQHLQRSPPGRTPPCTHWTRTSDYPVWTNPSHYEKDIFIRSPHQVTTPFILSVCLADFLNAIVTLPIQATRWQLDSGQASTSLQIHVQGLEAWGWSRGRIHLPAVSNHPIYCAGSYFKHVGTFWS